ncbi:MAG: protein TolR [Pseudomonadota bacterium]
MSEINVTPFVDVMLVLLIIFMVAAPLMVSGIPLQLPTVTATPLPNSQDPLTVSVDRDGRIYIGSNEEPIERDALVAKLKANEKSGTDTTVLVRGDENVPYGAVVRVVGALKEGGFNKATLLTELETITSGPAQPLGN